MPDRIPVRNRGGRAFTTMMISSDDTIVAVATPPGRGALGTVRLSGPAAVAIVQTLIGKPLSGPQALHHGWLTAAGKVIDEVMVAVMRAPRSFTGEDTVEITAHGNPVILRAIVEACCAGGARAAGPGEFTCRAFLNGKIDLARAEAVAEVISSASELGVQAASRQLEGRLSRRIHEWRERIVQLLAALEAALDYAEEDIRFLSPEALAEELARLRAEIRGLRETADKGRFLRRGFRVAIAGRPNTGKSSLLNALIERERAIVTDIPGTTRDVLEETLEIRGVPAVILDTAGLRAHTADPVERAGQDRTRQSVASADLVLWLLDGSEALSTEDRHIAEYFIQTGAAGKVLAVFNKSDRPAALDEAGLRAVFPGSSRILRISAATRLGMAELEEAIAAAAGLDRGLPDEPLIINLRHASALEAAGNSLEAAEAARARNETEEIVAHYLRETLGRLGEITGETATEEILGTIFSRFCVGK